MAQLYYLLSIFLISLLDFQLCLSKPTDVAITSDTLNPVHVENSEDTKSNVNREQRSPQFGLLGGDYHDYSDYDDDPRHFKLGHKRKFHKLHHKPYGHHGPHGPHGCHGCGGYPGHGEYYGGPHPGGQGGSFSSASAGSLGVGAGPFGGHSQSHAQSASFNFGPYSATFSVAHSASLRKGL